VSDLTPTDREPLLIKPAIRIAAALLVVVVAVVVVLKVLSGTDSYEVTAKFQDAGQVVKGNQVRVAGATVGTVSSIGLADDGQALLRLKISEKDYQPLHEGTRVILRNSSLSSIANRIMVLEPGPNNAPRIKNGGVIEAEDTRAATDIDQVLTTIDAKGRQYLQTLVRGGATAFSGAEKQTNEVLERLQPALAQTSRTIDELGSDEPALQRLVTGAAGVSSTVASNTDDLEQGLESTAVTLKATAAEREALRAAIRRGPSFLRRANTAFASTRIVLREARPLLREVRPVAPRLATTLRLADPLTAATVPLLRDVRATLPSLSDTLGRTPGLARQVNPATSELTRTLRGYKPILTEVRNYAPDLASGLLTGFGGKAGGYYDANGHYARIAPVLNSTALGDIVQPVLGGLDSLLTPIFGNGVNGTLASLLGTGLNTPSTKQQNRCPGAGAQTHPDGSNPNPAGHGGRCDLTQIPPGNKHPVTRTKR
jgi:phospholipid/cholesterol/gamma-HCH transport system substrate-binding protein